MTEIFEQILKNYDKISVKMMLESQKIMIETRKITIEIRKLCQNLKKTMLDSNVRSKKY